jgi:hypothetical protein
VNAKKNVPMNAAVAPVNDMFWIVTFADDWKLLNVTIAPIIPHMKQRTRGANGFISSGIP